MAELLKGMPVVKALNETLIHEVTELKNSGIHPALAILRIGEKPDDLAYEKSAVKRCDAIGVAVKTFVLPIEASEKDAIAMIHRINQDTHIHGLLMFRPLPKHINETKVNNAIDPKKDVDGSTNASLAGVFAGIDLGYAPCTPAACMELLDYYKINLTGKRVAVIGRSLVVGRPVAMMLMNQNATVTICHTKTENLEQICKDSDILVVAAGRIDTITRLHLKPEHIVIDVGIHVNDSGNLCGDVNLMDAEDIVTSVTPVPGGVGSVTTSVLMKHVIHAAKQMI